VQKRTFPHGHSAELLRAKRFTQIDPSRLSEDDREHVTKFYYSHAGEFRILNLENLDTDYAKLNFVVDTLDDLRRVEEMESKVQYDFTPRVKVTANERRKLGVAVIGLGIGERHLRAYHADPRCKVRWLLDYDHEKARFLLMKPGRGLVRVLRQF